MKCHRFVQISGYSKDKALSLFPMLESSSMQTMIICVISPIQQLLEVVSESDLS